MTTTNPLTQRVTADVYETPDDAAAAMLGALEGIPTHFDVANTKIWRFNDTVKDKGGKWTWAFSITCEVGGYTVPYMSDEVIRTQRRSRALSALTDAIKEARTP